MTMLALIDELIFLFIKWSINESCISFSQRPIKISKKVIPVELYNEALSLSPFSFSLPDKDV